MDKIDRTRLETQECASSALARAADARRHLCRLYDARAPPVWNSYAAAFIFAAAIGSPLAGGREYHAFRGGHEGSFSRGRGPILSANVHLAAFDRGGGDPVQTSCRLVLDARAETRTPCWDYARPASFEEMYQSNATPILCSLLPHRAAATHELIGLNEEREGLRQADGIGNIEPRPAGRNVSHRAIDAAATAKGEHAVFEHPVSGRCSFLDSALFHRRGPNIAILTC